MFHNDQQGTAIVLLAALVNSGWFIGRARDMAVVVSGAGAVIAKP